MTPTSLTSISVPGTVVRSTTCTLDCPDACSLAVTVTDGVITDIDAGPGNPLTDGWICKKVKQHTQRVYSPDRVLTPLIRVGSKGSGEFRAATWDEALTLISGQMKRALADSGPHSIVPFTYNSSAGIHEGSGVTEALFEALGAATVEHSICAATAGAAWASVIPGLVSADPFDVVHTKLVIVWGANPTISNTHFPPLVQQAVKNGAKVVVIDPRKTAMAKRADLHLALRPGTDVVLAMAVANHWASKGYVNRTFTDQYATGVGDFLAEASKTGIEQAAEICGLTVADIEVFAELYGTTKPSMLRIGWGQERNANGGAACRAILSLPVLGGHFGVKGSGIIGATSSGTSKDPKRRWPAFKAPVSARRNVLMHTIGEWLAPDAGDPCRVLFVQGANPALMCPDTAAVHAALAREDIFTIVHEQVLTDTARFADVVLPATTAFEINDVAGSYGSFTIQPVRAVIDRVGESRSNDEVGLAIANAMDFAWEMPTQDCVDDVGPRVTRTQTIQFVDTFPEGGKANLIDPDQGAPQYVPIFDSTYPLTLISPASSKTISSMFGEFQSPKPTVMMHPIDAASRKLVDGQEVAVVNDRGQVPLTLIVSDETCPGTVVTPKGIWLRNYAKGVGVNELMPMTTDPLVGGACFNDTRVEVRELRFAST
jgi:anaerobic selenocysteine-containing dehydrogenase